MLYLFFLLVHFVKYIAFMWAVGFGVLLLISLTGVDKPLKSYLSGTNKVLGALMDLLGKFLEWAFKLTMNASWWAARICIALVINVLTWVANMIRVRRQPALAPWPYRPMPVWVNLFPKRRNPAPGHGGGGGHH